MRRTRRTSKKLALACIASSAYVLGGAGSACADPSSWLFMGGGAGRVGLLGEHTNQGLLQIGTGLGSSADAPVSVGGVFKTLIFFGRGTDLDLTARMATGGFVRGAFGIAVDAGGYARFWERGSFGFAGALVLGAPYGLELTAQTEIGSNDAQTYALVLGIDFMRLTVFRSVGLDWLPNPSPGYAAH